MSETSSVPALLDVVKIDADQCGFRPSTLGEEFSKYHGDVGLRSLAAYLAGS